MMSLVNPHYERLLRLIAEARRRQGLERPIDFVKATGLSKSTIDRLGNGQELGDASLRIIAKAIGWTSDSAGKILAGGEPTLESETASADADVRYEVEDDPDGSEDVGMIVRNTVIEVVGVLAPNTPLSEVQEIEALALKAVLQRGGRPRQRHHRAFQDVEAADSSAE